MKSRLIFAALLLFFSHCSYTQSIEELYNNRDFKSLIKHADNADSLSTDDLYCVGYAFFQLEDDASAIKMYDKAIEKGLDDDYIYLYKGLSLRYSNQEEEAIKNFKLAIDRNPKGQKNHTELANSFYHKKEYATALVHFEKARSLSYELGDPYFKLPHIYHIQQEFEKALIEYYKSADLIDMQDPVYLELLKEIGVLEFVVTKDYEKSIAAYEKVVALAPTDYDIYPKLIKSYYANEDFKNGERLFEVLKKEYLSENLSEDFQKFGNVPISEFELDGQKVIIYRYFNEPKESLDLMYKIYLLSKDGKTIERTLMTEKTIQLEDDGAKHLLCESEKDGGHRTYPLGWSTDEIEYNSLKEAVLKVLKQGVKPTASSKFVQPKQEPKSSKKKDKKEKGKKKGTSNNK